MFAKTNQAFTYASIGTSKSQSCKSFYAKIVLIKNQKKGIKK